MGKMTTPDNKTKKGFEELKADFLVAVKDKKRWISCLIEVGIMCLLLAVDLLVKEYLYGYCKQNGDVIIIDKVIRFTAVENTGASFGMFKGSTTALSVVSLVSSVLLIGFMFYSYPRKNKWLRASLVMITAGALGNVVDRLAFGYVRDMVYFELIDFPVWNFADNCLCIGTAVLIVYIIFFYSKDDEKIKQSKEEKELSSKINALLNEVEDDESRDAE